MAADGPVGIITGAGSGIGAAIAREFAGIGAQMVLASIDTEGMDQLAATLDDLGGAGLVAEVDVRSVESVAKLPILAREAFGPVDFVVANAAVIDHGDVATGEPAEWRRVLETNLLGTMHTVGAVLPEMYERRCGHVFVMASVSGRVSYVGEPAYIASKWGLVGFANSLRIEADAHDVRVSLIEPGLVNTGLARQSDVGQLMLASSASLNPEDIARTLLYIYQQPRSVVVSEIVVRAVNQAPIASPAVG